MTRVVIQQHSNEVVVTRVEPRVCTPTPVNAVVELDYDQPTVELPVDCRPPRMVEVVTPGPAGPPGETEGATFLAVAGETIHGRRIVRIANDLIYHPLMAVPAHAGQCIGLALQSGSTGAELLVRTSGQHADPGWNWLPGPVWCSDQGVLTQGPVSSGWLLKVGVAVNATTLNIDIDDPIIRSP